MREGWVRYDWSLERRGHLRGRLQGARGVGLTTRDGEGTPRGSFGPLGSTLRHTPPVGPSFKSGRVHTSLPVSP